MSKRGQIAIFVILGIILVVSLVLVGVFKGGEVKRAVEKQIGTTSELGDAAEEVEAIVQECLDKAIKESFKDMNLIKTDNYKKLMETFIKAKMSSCVDLNGMDFEVVSGELKNVEVDYKQGSSKISVKLDYDLAIKKGDSTQRFDEFYVDIDYTPSCCVPAKVDGDCRATKTMTAYSCGRIFKLDKAESLKKDGECLAC